MVFVSTRLTKSMSLASPKSDTLAQKPCGLVVCPDVSRMLPAPHCSAIVSSEAALYAQDTLEHGQEAMASTTRESSAHASGMPCGEEAVST